MGGLLAALVMKFGMLGALAFKGLVLLVGKALLVSKIALLLAVVIGLKKLFSHQKHVTYEVSKKSIILDRGKSKPWECNSRFRARKYFFIVIKCIEALI